jgi:hypothetical protein
MKVRMIRNNGMEKAKAGDIIETSPAHAAFLIRFGWADPVTVREQIETPEEPKIVKKTTRKLKK